MPQGCFVPMEMIGQEQWFLLGFYGKKHVLRFIGWQHPKDVKDPSGHTLRQMVVEGSVKWRPREAARLIIRDLAPLGAR